MIKIIWILISINVIALLVFISAYFVINNGKNVDTMERGWTIILAGLGLLFILLAALPLRFGHSTFSLLVAGIFAALPLVVVSGILLSDKLPSFKKKSTFATTYFKERKQIAIASAIENNDTTLLKELIKGEDLNIQGIKVWDWPGLNYLQFAVRLRSNRGNFPFNDAANLAAIRILIANGSVTTPALAEATKQLPVVMVAEFLTAGADPNTKGYVNPNPLLFETIGSSKEQNDMAILLVSRGAKVNAKYDNGYTPVMFAAYSAGTTPLWNDTWRLVRYLLEEAHADYAYTTSNGDSLARIIENITMEAEAKKITMPPDFDKVVGWLKQHNVDIVAGIE